MSLSSQRKYQLKHCPKNRRNQIYSQSTLESLGTRTRGRNLKLNTTNKGKKSWSTRRTASSKGGGVVLEEKRRDLQQKERSLQRNAGSNGLNKQVSATHCNKSERSSKKRSSYSRESGCPRDRLVSETKWVSSNGDGDGSLGSGSPFERGWKSKLRS
jgi:hypothetical protein